MPLLPNGKMDINKLATLEYKDNNKNEIKDCFNKIIDIINPSIIEKTGSSFYLEFYKINSDFSTEKI